MSRFFFTLLIATLLAAPFVVFLGVVSAEDAPPAATTPTYERLAPLPLPTIAVGEGLSGYLKTLFWLTISAAGVLAVLMITVGGVQYMLSEAFNTKADAKNRITMAIFGFLLAISSVLILQTINPELLQFKLLTRLSDLKSSLVFDLSAPSGVLTESPTKPGCSTLADFFGSVVQSCSWIHSKAAGNISACRYTVGELQAAGGGGSEARNYVTKVDSYCAGGKPAQQFIDGGWQSPACCAYVPPANGCTGLGVDAGYESCVWYDSGSEFNDACISNAFKDANGSGFQDRGWLNCVTGTSGTNNECCAK